MSIVSVLKNAVHNVTMASKEVAHAVQTDKKAKALFIYTLYIFTCGILTGRGVQYLRMKYLTGGKF